MQDLRQKLDQLAGPDFEAFKRIIQCNLHTTETGAEDIAHEGLLHVWENQNWEPHIILAAMYKGRNHLRGERRHKRHTAHYAREHLRDVAHAPSVLDELVAREDRQHDARILMAAIQALPCRQRQVFLLHLDGFTPQQVAARLGIDKRSAIVTLSRAKANLRKRLGRAA